MESIIVWVYELPISCYFSLDVSGYLVFDKNNKWNNSMLSNFQNRCFLTLTEEFIGNCIGLSRRRPVFILNKIGKLNLNFDKSEKRKPNVKIESNSHWAGVSFIKCGYWNSFEKFLLNFIKNGNCNI